MKKLITVVLLVLSNLIYSQECERIKNLRDNISQIEKKRNLIKEEFIKETFFFSDEFSMREVTMVQIEIQKRNLETNFLIIQLEYKDSKEKIKVQKSLFITDRSVINYNNKYGFKLITSNGEYDEEIFIYIESKEMKQWFQTLLEGFSGRKINEKDE